MQPQAAAQQQLAGSHGTLRHMLSDCDTEFLHRTLPDATIGSIASIYAHIVFGEDAFVQSRFQGKPTIYQSSSWEEKTQEALRSFPSFFSYTASASKANPFED